MSKLARNLVTLVIAAFIVVMMVLVATSMMREQAPTKSTLAHTLEDAPDDLTMMAAAPADFYGEQWRGIVFVCPGFTQADMEKGGVDIEPFNFVDGKIPEGDNYIVAVDTAGNSFVEYAKRSDIDVCSTQQVQGAVDAFQLLPFARTGEGGWVLAA